MRILVTGASGQVGGALVPALQHLGTVIATSRAQLDLARPWDLPPRLDEIAPDIIINPAAYTAVDQAEDEPELAMRVNAAAPGEIAGWALKNDVPLIHFSTDYVFNGAGERPWSEDDHPEPLSTYGKSKLAGEEAIRVTGGDFLVVRSSWIYAARGKNFLCTVARLARERKELRVVADQIGAPTSARFIAQVVARIIANEPKLLRTRMREAKGLVHVAASGETSWCQFAAAIISGLRDRGTSLAIERVTPVRTQEYPTRAKRPHNSRLSLERLQKVFAVQSPDWEQDLERELDLFVKQLGRS
jgi:dTDP-4-dehydrorhamnose reductase